MRPGGFQKVLERHIRVPRGKKGKKGGARPGDDGRGWARIDWQPSFGADAHQSVPGVEQEAEGGGSEAMDG